MPNHNGNRVLSMSNSTFNKLRAVTQYWLPALGTFYAAIALIWGLPYAEEVGGTILALVTFLGAILGISRKSYHDSGADRDGDMIVDTDGGDADVYSLAFNEPLELLTRKDTVTLEVKKKSQ